MLFYLAMAIIVTKVETIEEELSWIVLCTTEDLKGNSSKLFSSNCWIYIYHHPFNSNALSTTLCTLHTAYVDTILLRLLLKHYSALCVSQKVRLSTTMWCTLFWTWQLFKKTTLISLINVEVEINVEGVQKLPNH